MQARELIGDSPTGCSNRPSSKAAASEGPRRTWSSGRMVLTTKEHHVRARRRVSEANRVPVEGLNDAERSWRAVSASC